VLERSFSVSADALPGAEPGPDRWPVFRLTVMGPDGPRELTSQAFQPDGSLGEPGVCAGVEPSSGLGATYRLETRPESGALVAHLELRAGQRPVAVREPALGLAWHLTGGATVHWVDGVRLEEQDDFPASFLHRTWPLAKGARRRWVSLHPGLRPTSSNRFVPWFAVVDGEGVGVAGSLVWSGAWQLVLERGPHAAYAAMGLARFERTLQPGEGLEVPPLCLTVGTGALEGAVGRWHHLLRGLAPRWPAGPGPWVQFNSWYPWQKNLDEAEMLRHLDAVADLGVEVFVLDDGWFLGSDPRRPWGAGAGTWREHPGKFPSGLWRFGEQVKARGLRFGLWVEPERVDLAMLEVAGVRPEWLARSGGRLVEGAATPSGVLCFGCPEVVRWACDRLTALVEGTGADWLKWDHNLYGVCDEPTHGHGPGDGNWAHLQGVWAVWATLRRRFPRLVLENCASGGPRLDLGLFTRSHLTWVSDLPAPSRRARSHAAGAVLAFPPEHLNGWVVLHAEEPLDESSVAYQFRSRFLGAFGLSCPVDRWPRELLRRAAEELARYKRWRELLAHGEVHPLLPQETSGEPWWAVGLVADGGRRAAVLAFRELSPEATRRLPLRGLEEGGLYEVVDEDTGRRSRLSGGALMAAGLEVSLARPKQAALAWLRRIG
jgi:alpha-galactosidase